MLVLNLNGKMKNEVGQFLGMHKYRELVKEHATAGNDEDKELYVIDGKFHTAFEEIEPSEELPGQRRYQGKGEMVFDHYPEPGIE